MASNFGRRSNPQQRIGAGLHFADAAIAWCIPDPPCPGDANGDGAVDLSDLLDVIGNWGGDGSEGGDVNGDNAVNLDDLLEVIGNWGSSCA